MIGAERFAEKIEMLPGERIVWEGGASPKGLVVALLQGIVGIILIFVLVAVFAYSGFFYYVDNPNYIDEPVTTVEGGNASISDSEEMQPRKILSGTRFVTYWVTVLLIAIVMFIYVLSKAVRNYWLVATNERICIRSGVLYRNVVTVDLDKVTSIRSFHGPIERRFGLHSLEVQHSGTNHNRSGWSFFDPHTIHYVSNAQQLSSTVLKNWLPRDNAAR